MNHKIIRNINEVNNHKIIRNHKSAHVVDTQVGLLIEKWNAPQYTPLFRKACWYLSEAQIQTFIEKSTDGKKESPFAYFIACIKDALIRS